MDVPAAADSVWIHKATVGLIAGSGLTLGAILCGAKISSIRKFGEVLTACAIVCNALIDTNPTVIHADGVDYYKLPDTEHSRQMSEQIEEARLILEQYGITEESNELNEENIDKKIKEQEKEYEKAEHQAPQRDPLIINFSDSNEIEFTTLEEGVNFDLDNNGFAEQTAWIKNNDGILALDINENNQIDDGGELFGDRFQMPDGRISKTGFEALLGLD